MYEILCIDDEGGFYLIETEKEYFKGGCFYFTEYQKKLKVL